MVKRIFLIALVQLLLTNANAQKVEKSVVLSEGKSAKLYAIDGGNTIANVTNCGNAGVVLAANNKWTFFNSNFEERWTIEQIYKYKTYPMLYREWNLGNSQYFYSLQFKLRGGGLQESPVELTAIQIDLKSGQKKEKVVPFGDKNFFLEKAYMSESGVHFFCYELNSKENSVRYFLCTIDPATLVFKQVEVKLPSNKDDESKGLKMSYPSRKRFLWNPYILENGKVLLFNLSEDIERKEEWILNFSYTFLEPSGKIGELKSIKMKSSYNFSKPQFSIDVQNNILYCFGYLCSSKYNAGLYLISETLNEKKINSYILPFKDLEERYDLRDQQLLGKKGIPDKYENFNWTSLEWCYNEAIGSNQFFTNPNSKTITIGFEEPYTSFDKTPNVKRISLNSKGELLRIDQLTNNGLAITSPGYRLLPIKRVNLYGSGDDPLIYKAMEKIGPDMKGDCVVFFVGENGNQFMSIEAEKSRIKGYKIVE